MPQSSSPPSQAGAVPSRSPLAAEPSGSPGAKPAAKKPRGLWYDLDLRLQPELFDWLAPATPRRAPFFTNDYNFLTFNIRPGMGYDEKMWQVRAQLQGVFLFNLPIHAIAPAPAGALGTGASYFSLARTSDSETVGIRQLYAHVGELNKTGLQLGRIAYEDQNDVPSIDPMLAFQKSRFTGHLMGDQGYVTFGRTWDGLRGDFDTQPIRVTGVAVKPTQMEPHFGTDIVNMTVYHGALTFKEKGLLPNGEGQIFYNHYDDTRKVAEIDNRAAALRPTIDLEGGNHIDTVGFHYMTKLGPDGEAFAWYAHQGGMWGTRPHDANAFQVEAGYKFSKVAWKPWFRLGYSLYSGDGNAVPGRTSPHGTWQGFATNGRNQGMAFYTQANVRDLLGQIILQPRKETQFRLDLHGLTLDNKNDLWYAGAPAIQNQGINGLVGRPSGGSTDLGIFMEAVVTHRFNPNNLLMFHYLQAWGGRVVKTTFPKQSDAHQIYLEYHFLLP